MTLQGAVGLSSLIVALLGSVPGTGFAAENVEPEELEPATQEEDLLDEDLQPASSAAALNRAVEEIVITGSATAGILEEEETTSAITFEPETLRMEGIRDISDLSNFAPNLEIKTAFAATNPTLFIRGIGLDDYNANSASAVAVYQDGVYMNSPVGQLFQFFDVESVNVLRGPQARLRNANAGAILIHSREPSDTLGGYGEVSYGNFNAITVSSALNVPIVPEMLSSRLAFVVNKRDGITKNRCHRDAGDFSTACGTALPEADLDEYVNDIDNWAARAMLLLTPEIGDWAAPELLLNVHGGKNDSGAAQFQHRGFRRRFGEDGPLVPFVDRSNYQDRDGDPFAGDYNAQGKEKISLLGGSLRVAWPVSDRLEVVSLSAYEWHDRDTLSNDDASPRVLFDRFNYRDNAWQFSEELIFRWLFAESGELDLGGLFLMEDLEVDNIFPNEKPGTRMPRIEQYYKQETRGFSIYANARSDMPAIEVLPELFSNFSLEGTARYSREYKRFALETQATTFFRGNPTVLPQLSESVSKWWDGLSGDIALTYYLGRQWGNEDVSMYVKYSRGWKPGLFNGGTALAVELVEPVGEETVDSLEAGFRTSWFEQKLDVSLTAFYYWFKDMQTFLLQQEGTGVPLPRLINAEDVRIRGVELELRAEPIEGLVLDVNAGWVRGEYESFVSTIVQPKGPLRAGVEIIETNYSGNQMLASPVWSGSASIEYTVELGRFGWLRPRYSVSYKDDIFFDPNEGAGLRGNLQPGTMGQDAYWLHNAMLTYTTPDQRIEVTGWVRNFLNEEYRVQSFDLTERNFQFVIDAYADPRTYGITAVFRF